MSQNTNKLVIALILILLFMFGLFWLGVKQSITPIDTSTPRVENTPIATQSAKESIDGEKAVVSKVVDGDTIELQTGETVRFIGIDTPETVDPRRPVGCFGKEASNKTKELLLGKTVILKKDVSETDKYKRLLRYVYLPLEDGQTLFVNDYLVRTGYAKNYTYPPDVKFNEQFKQAEKQAREAKLGLWSKC